MDNEDALYAIGDSIRRCFISPNENDRNLEPANVVDALMAIARAINNVADKLELIALHAEGIRRTRRS